MPAPTPPPGFTLAPTDVPPAPPPGFSITRGAPPAPPPGFELEASSEAGKINTPAPAMGFGDVVGNLAAGVGERVRSLAGGIATTVGELGEEYAAARPSWPSVVIGGERGFGVHVMSQEEADAEAARGSVADLTEILKSSGRTSQETDLGYEPITTFGDVLDAEGVLPTIGEALKFGAEQAVVSLPDMAAALTSLPAYLTARTGEIAKNRADVRGELAEEPTPQEIEGIDLTTAAGAATISSLLERFGAERVLKMVPGLDAGVLRRIAGAATAEAGTEAGQEGTEYVAERIGQAPIEGDEAFMRMAAGAVGGAGAGATLRTGVEAVSAAARAAAPDRAGAPIGEPATTPAPQAAAPESAESAPAPPGFGDELEVEAQRAPKAATGEWTADTAAGPGEPFAFLGDAEKPRARMIETEAGIEAILEDGQRLGPFERPSEAADAVDAALEQVQTSAPGLGDELGGDTFAAATSAAPATTDQGLTVPPAPETTVQTPNLQPASADSSFDAVEQPAPPAAAPAPRKAAKAPRKAVADMTLEEARAALLTHDLTGIPNRRAYEESPKLPEQTAIDVDSLKWVNDNMGHDSGNELLRAVGDALREETGGQNVYHLSGDEFALQSATPEEAAEIMARVSERLAGAVISVTMPDGQVVTLSGIGVSYGTGKDLTNADAALQAHKTEREARGQRAGRGESPAGATRVAAETGRQDHLGDATAAEAQGDRDGRPQGVDADQTVEPAETRSFRSLAERREQQRAEGMEGDSDVELASQLEGELTAEERGQTAAIEKMLGGAKNAPRVRFVHGTQGIPRAVMARLRERSPGLKLAGAYDPANNHVYINTDAITSPAAAAFTAAHEIAGHYGLRGFVGRMAPDARKRLDRALELAAQNPTVQAVATSLREKRAVQGLQSIEEALAELAAAGRTGNYQRIQDKYGVEVPDAQRQRVRNVVERFIERVVEILKRFMGKQEAFSDKQVRELLEGAWRYVQSGETMAPAKGARVEQHEAFHGTRHKFDRFSLEHIGSGEGAQAFGWGLYFAESPGVARSYQTKLVDRTVVLDALTPQENASLPSWIRERVNSQGKPGVESVRQDFQARAAEEEAKLENPSLFAQPHIIEERLRNAQKIIALMDKIDAAGEYGGKRDDGALFKVDIDDGAVERMIDADKPLDAQKPAVRAALKKIEAALDMAFEWDRSGQAAYNRIGNAMNMDEDVHEAVGRELEGQALSERFDEASSKLLAKFGIPGLRYLDEQSRKATVPDQAHEAAARDLKKNGYSSMAAMAALQKAYPTAPVRELKVALADVYDDVTLPGTRNIVVFDDAIVTIKEINGEKVTPQQSARILDRSADVALAEELDDNVIPPSRFLRRRSKKLDEDIARERQKTQTPEREKRIRELIRESARAEERADELDGIELSEEGDVAQTETEAFKRWFGDSKVVDENGKPLVVYHGTNADVQTFRLNPYDIGIHAGSREMANAIFESKSDGFKQKKAPTKGRNVMPVYMRIENPLRTRDLDAFNMTSLPRELKRLGLIEDAAAWSKSVQEEANKRLSADFDRIAPNARTKGDLEDAGLSLDRQTDMQFERLQEVAREQLKEMGYDGLVYDNQFEGAGDTWIAFEPEQIKSAVGNRGTFDPNEADIALSEEPPQASKPQKASGGAGKRYVRMYREKGAPIAASAPGTLTVGTQDRAKTLEIPKEPVRREHVMKLFQRLFKAKIYEGKPFKVRGALGYFRPSNFEVRNKYRNDLEVAAHEMFHWLDRTYPTIRALYHKRRYADELYGVSYDDTKIFEGFAEFGRLFMTQEVEAITRLPTFYEAFVREARDVGILDKLEEVQRLMHQWYLQGAENRARSKIGTAAAPIRQRLAAMLDGFADRAIASSLDQLQAAKVIERETKGAIAEDAAMSPYKSMRLLAGARSTINTFLNYGTLKWTTDGDLDFSGKGLRQIFEPVADVFDEAMGYFVARRAGELRMHGKEKLFTPDEVAALRARAAKTGKLKEIEAAFEEYQSYTRRVLNFAVQSGILSGQTRDLWGALYQNYVPFYRVAEKFGSIDPRMTGGTRGGLFRRLTGGSANVADVFENITLNTALIVNASLKNVAKRQLFAAIESSPVGQRYAVKIPTSTEMRKVSMEQIERVLKEFAKEAEAKGRAGIADKLESAELALLARALAGRSNDLGQMTMSEIQDQATFFFTGRPPTIPDKEQVLVNGKPRWYQIGDPLLWDMLVATNYHQPLGLTEKVLGIAKRTLTRGVTITPEFQVANIIRDTFNAASLSKGKQLPVVDALRSLRDIWSESDAYKEFLANGGGFGNAIGDEAKRVRVMMKAPGVKGVLQSPAALIDFWDKWGQSFELATRLAEYKRVRAQGKTRREAAYQGREVSTDFAVRGHSALARWASISLAFFNARLQGLYRIERELFEKKGRQSWRGERMLSYAARSFSMLTMPSLLLYWFLNEDDEDYEELPEELKSLNTVLPAPDGDGVYLIPRPFETGALFQEVPIRLWRYYRDRDGKELAQAAKFMIANTFNFSPIPQLFAPPAAIWSNRQWNGLPVVPRNLQNVEPREQFQPWTPEVYKKVGEQFNVSPVKLQALVEGYLGTVGSYVVAAADALVTAGGVEEPTKRSSQYPLLRRFMREEPYTNTSFEQRFYDLLDEVTTVVDTTRKLRREARADDLQDYLGQQEKAALFAVSGATQDVMETAAELNAQMRAVRNDPAMSAEDKAAQIDELQAQQNELFRSAVEAFDEALLEAARDAIENE